MAGHGAEFTKKLRAAIKAKIEELGVEVDEELPDYIMVMVANKKEKNRMKNDLLLFLGKNSGVFVDWLFSFFEKLQNVGSGGGSTDEAGPRSKRTETTEKEEKATTSKSSKEKDSRKEEKSKAKKEDRKRDSPPLTKQKLKLRHEPEVQELAKISAKSSSSHRKESTSSNRNHPREHEEKEKPSKSTRPQIRAPTPPTPDVKKPKHRHEKEKPVEKSSSIKSEEPSLKRHRTIPSRPDYTPETGEEESEGEKERQVLRRALQEKKAKLKVNPEPSNRVVEGADEDSVDTFDESDYDDELNRGSRSPPRKTLKSEVVVQSKPQEMQPKLQSEVVVKGKDLKGRVFGGQSSLFLRAMSDASGFHGQNRPTSRRYQYDSDSEEGILQVPEVTPSARRTVTNRTVGEKPPKLEEIFNDEPKKHPRFIVTVKGYDGRTVQERPTDPFSEELQESLEDLQKERTPSPTFEEPPKDNNELFVENFPEEEEAVKKVARKRPKRADDPCMLVI